MRSYSSVSLFSGAGGLDYGLEKAGFDPLALVEDDKSCIDTLRQNRDWPVFGQRISRTTNICNLTGVRARRVDLLAGGPPCQPFSHAASWANGYPDGFDDDRADTIRHFMRIVEQLLPKVILLENVPGFARGRNSGENYVIQRLATINRKLGTKYVATTAVIDAADYGVPQHRRRFFLVAARDGTKFVFPAPAYGPRSTSKRRYVTAWDAIRGVKSQYCEKLAVRGRWAELLPSIPEGRNYLWHTDRGGGIPLFGWRTKYWSFLLKLAKRLPSWTLSASPSQNAGPFHWSNRQLSTDELLRLQTFPKDIKVSGDRSARQRQIGNAVPSLVGEILGRAIASQLLGQKSKNNKLKLAIALARKGSKASRVRKVSRQFGHLRGAHKDHPGTGKGPRARLRKKKKRDAH
jgi:DNA (cytosine-5)-methyltransferase 1